MKIFNLRIGGRLALAFTVQIVLLGSTAAYGLSRMDHMQASLGEITQVNQRETELASAMQMALADRMIALRNIALLRSDSEISAEIRRVDSAEKTYAAHYAKLESLLMRSASSSVEEDQALREAQQIAAGAEALVEDIISAAQRHSYDKASVLIVSQLAPLQVRWNAVLAKLVQIQTQQNQVVIASSETASSHARLVMKILACLSLLGSALLAWVITRSITQPINSLLSSLVHEAECATGPIAGN